MPRPVLLALALTLAAAPAAATTIDFDAQALRDLYAPAGVTLTFEEPTTLSMPEAVHLDTSEEKWALHDAIDYETAPIEMIFVESLSWCGGRSQSGIVGCSTGDYFVVDATYHSLTNLLAHEIGHSYALDHTSDPENVMHDVIFAGDLSFTPDQYAQIAEDPMDRSYAFQPVLVTTPEPTTAALLGAGLLGLAVRRR